MQDFADSMAAKVGALVLSGASVFGIAGCQPVPEGADSAAASPVYRIDLEETTFGHHVVPAPEVEGEALLESLLQVKDDLAIYLEKVGTYHSTFRTDHVDRMRSERKVMSDLVDSLEQAQDRLASDLREGSRLEQGTLVHLNGQLEKLRGLVGDQRVVGETTAHGRSGTSNSNFAEVLEAKGEIDAVVVILMGQR